MSIIEHNTNGRLAIRAHVPLLMRGYVTAEPTFTQEITLTRKEACALVHDLNMAAREVTEHNAKVGQPE
jgi:hypothetical protein